MKEIFFYHIENQLRNKFHLNLSTYTRENRTKKIGLYLLFWIINWIHIDKTMRFRVAALCFGSWFPEILVENICKGIHRNSSEDGWLTITAIKTFNGLQ